MLTKGREAENLLGLFQSNVICPCMSSNLEVLVAKAQWMVFLEYLWRETCYFARAALHPQ